MSVDPAQVAAAVLGRRPASVEVESPTPVAYDAYVAGRVVERVAGVAVMPGGDRRDWTAIVKRTAGGAGLRAARRELAAYRLGLASPATRRGLRSPVLLAYQDQDDTVELWMEDVSDVHGGEWAPERYRVAARHIGTWNARSRRVPPDFDAEDAWAERHGLPDKMGDALAEIDRVAESDVAARAASMVGEDAFARSRALVASTASRIALLATFPRTLLHHDLNRSNLFAVDDESTVAIDWENVGHGPLGVDLAPLVIGSVRRGDAPSEQLAELEALVLAGYAEGLAEAGAATGAEIAHAYRLAVGLRWHVVLGTIRVCIDPSMAFRGSRPDEPNEESLRHLVALTRYILDVGLGSGP